MVSPGNGPPACPGSRRAVPLQEQMMASFVLAVVLALTALPLLAGWAAATWRGAHGAPQDAAWFVGGILVAAALVWWRRPNWLVHTFVHESCHAVACLVT